MAEKCRKAKGATLERCEAAQYAISAGLIHLQCLRNMETGARRERLALKKGKEWAPLHFCPWCRADIDTRPAAHKESTP